MDKRLDSKILLPAVNYEFNLIVLNSCSRLHPGQRWFESPTVFIIPFINFFFIALRVSSQRIAASCEFNDSKPRFRGTSTSLLIISLSLSLSLFLSLSILPEHSVNFPINNFPDTPDYGQLNWTYISMWWLTYEHMTSKETVTQTHYRNMMEKWI